MKFAGGFALLGSAFYMASGAGYMNAARFGAAGLYATSETIQIMYGKGGAKHEATKQECGGGQATTAPHIPFYQKVLNPKDYPIETSFSIGIAASVLSILSGTNITGAEIAPRWHEVTLGVALIGAFTAGAVGDEKYQEREDETYLSYYKSQVLGYPMRNTAVLFLFASVNQLLSGIQAGDGWQISSGIAYIASDWHYFKSEKKNQSVFTSKLG